MLDTPPHTSSAVTGSVTAGRPHALRAVGPAVGAGLLAAAAVVALRTSGALTGLPALVAAAAALLAVPTSRLLSRRVLVAAALVVGVVPATWWWPLALPGGRVTWLLALVVGALVAGALWRGPRQAVARARAALPRPGVVELVPLAAGAVTAVVAAAWLRVSDPATMLGSLTSGWDNSAHFSMVRMLRVHGVTTDRLADPVGEHWKFTDYPQGVHALLASVAELLAGPEVRSGTEEVLLYGTANAVLLVLLAVTVAAGVCALPWLHRRPEAAVPLATFAVAAFVLGPGGSAYTGGFVNFVVGAALCGCLVLLAVTVPRVFSPLHVAAVGSLVVAVAHAWILLLALAVPAAALVLVPFTRERFHGTRTEKALTVAVGVLTLLGVLRALDVLRALRADEVLVIPGGVTVPPLGVLLAVVLGSIGLCLWGAGHTGGARVAWAALVPAGGLLGVALVAGMQLSAGAGLSYYFWKLLIGVELVSCVVLVVALARVLPPSPPQPPGRWARVLTGLGTLVLAASASQVLGGGGTGRAAFAPAPDPGVTAQAAQVVAAVAAAPADADVTLVLDHAETGMHPIQAQQWFLALRGRWTVESNDAAAVLVGPDGLVRDTVATAEAALGTDPSRVVVVSPEVAATLQVVAPDLTADRVATW